MNLARIKPVIVKEFRQIRRDKRTLGILIFVPAFLLVMYGYALDLDVKHVPAIVYDADNSRASRDFLDHFFLGGHSEYFDRVATVNDARTVDEMLADGRVTVALVIPHDFSEKLHAGKQAHVQVLVNGIMASTAATVTGYVDAITQQYSLQRIQAGAATRPVAYEPRVWYNSELKSVRFLIPGLVAFLLMIVTVVATTLSVVRERELGSMEQLMVSPLYPGELIVGKLVPYALIMMVATALVLASAYVLFGMPIRGSYFLLFIAALLYLCGALGMGLLISTLVRTQEVAFLLASIISLLPTFILSGFVFPISNMPVVIQAVTYIVPARYFLVVLRGIMLKGVGLESFGDQFLFLAGFAALMLVAGTVRLKKIMG